ncbi:MULTISPECIES: 50S ribosomal protein L3 [Metallosphaera]|uniref:50S ribosomal protein L3 n=1 Tax=Metallosphaera TaxID=41980 RepID=UPI001F063D0A|nr:50S ribosomal protein L3 [Metallosphaera sedula]MCH1771878.1 50S ribosomal protein L3 [Metallosphaera sedula]MCP6729207.1 50S ribosomal protein L3 [Metallosphaera sedula]
MGHRKLSSPRRGSAGLRPRKRSEELLPSPRSYPEVNLPNPVTLGFVGYKVGMTHIFMIDEDRSSSMFGKEIYVPVTVLETPPIYVLALRAYGLNNRGEHSVMGEVWGDLGDFGKFITRRIRGLKIDKEKKEHQLKDIESNLESVSYFRLLVSTQPHLIPALGKKTPDIVEVQIGGGNTKSQLEYGLKLLGNTLSVRDVFKEGQLMDIIGVTKGHGFQGVIKRYGVQELPRWHKHRKGSRKVGTKGPSLGTPSYVPQPGQMGFHRRTEYNKRILKISDDTKLINPKGGFVRYGLVKNTYLLVQGSTIGSIKRPLFLRYPIRPYSTQLPVPKVTYVDVNSKQG